MLPRSATPSDDRLHALDAHFVTQVDAVTRRELAAHRRRLEEISPETGALVEMLASYLEGGKLLRPRFCFWAGVAALGREPEAAEVEALARYGASIELIQAAALMHDDVIDHSPMRRGRPALHVRAAQQHHQEALFGSSEDFGIATAIVLGDLALSWGEQMAGAVQRDPAPTLRARTEFDALRTEVMSGQYLDILHQAGGYASSPDPERAALSVIRWKTVPYTVLRPVRIGAALMGAEDADLETLSAWAIEVGTAFQLRDDLLSVIGDQDETGKPIGGDIVEGKRTVLLARTEKAADAEGRALLESVIGDGESTEEGISAVHELMVATGAVASVAQEVRDRAGRGRQLLESAPTLGTLGRAGLGALAEFATEVESLPA